MVIFHAHTVNHILSRVGRVMLLQTKERTKAWNSQIPWQCLRVRHHDIRFLLLVGDKKYAFFKVLVECRMKGVMGVV